MRFFLVLLTLSIAFQFSTDAAQAKTKNQPAPAETENEGDIETYETDSKVLYKDQKMRINPYIGLGLFSIEGIKDGGTAPGFNLGATVDFGVTALVYEAGLFYFQTGDKGTTTSGGYQLDYLAIPLLARYYTSGDQSGFYLKAGLMPSLLLAATLKGDSSLKDTLKGFDTLAVVGFGFRLEDDRIGDLLVEATFNRGLLDLNDTNTGDALHNQGINVAAGITL